MPVRDTSIESNALLDKETRQRIVANGLREFIKTLGTNPSAYELLEFMKIRDRQGFIKDLNSVRPRLTELKDKQIVKNFAKKKCSVTGRTVYTWGLAA